jgi:hypothetical protein
VINEDAATSTIAAATCHRPRPGLHGARGFNGGRLEAGGNDGPEIAIRRHIARQRCERFIELAVHGDFLASCMRTPSNCRARCNWARRFRRRYRASRRLPHAKTIDARQHEHVPCAGRQAGDGRFEVAVRSRIGHRSVGPGIRHFFLGGRVDTEQLGPSPPVREDGVHRDAVQPGAETAADLESRQAAPGLDEGFLSAVLGGLALGRHPQAQTVYPSDVAPVQCFECRGRAGGRRLDQPAFVGRLPGTLEFAFGRVQRQCPPRLAPAKPRSSAGIVPPRPDRPARRLRS